MSDRFKPCHALVNPDLFRDNCIFDMCEYNGMEKTLCDNVEAYAQACQSAGVTISWRNTTFCRKLSWQQLKLLTKKKKWSRVVYFNYLCPIASYSHALPSKQPLLWLHSSLPPHLRWSLPCCLSPASNHLCGGLPVWRWLRPERWQMRFPRQMWLRWSGWTVPRRKWRRVYTVVCWWV